MLLCWQNGSVFLVACRKKHCNFGKITTNIQPFMMPLVFWLGFSKFESEVELLFSSDSWKLINNNWFLNLNTWLGQRVLFLIKSCFQNSKPIVYVRIKSKLLFFKYRCKVLPPIHFYWVFQWYISETHCTVVGNHWPSILYICLLKVS